MPLIYTILPSLPNPPSPTGKCNNHCILDHELLARLRYRVASSHSPPRAARHGRLVIHLPASELASALCVELALPCSPYAASRRTVAFHDALSSVCSAPSLPYRASSSHLPRPNPPPRVTPRRHGWFAVHLASRPDVRTPASPLPPPFVHPVVSPPGSVPTTRRLLLCIGGERICIFEYFLLDCKNASPFSPLLEHILKMQSTCEQHKWICLSLLKSV